MEHVLREKAKAFWAMRRSYEAMAKHNQVSDLGAEQEEEGYPGQSEGVVKVGLAWR